MRATLVVLMLGLSARLAMAQPQRVELGPCDCARSKVCWSAVLEAFTIRSGQSRAEVDGALPGRFFPSTETFALEKPDRQGNFLSVTCGPGRTPCGERRSELQRRLIFASLLSSLPLSRPEGALYHPRSWTLTDEGETEIARLRRCKPEMLDELAGILMGGKL